MEDKDWLNEALASMHSGQWFGWKKEWTGKHRMSYENIIVHDSSITKPTENQLSNYETAGNTAESNALVDAKRRQDYGTWNQQLDEMYHDFESWKARIKKIKDDNPKE